MAGLVNASKDIMLTSLVSAVEFVSLHTADPSTDGGSEVSGGTYARRPVEWAAAASGSVSSSATVVFNVPGDATTITHLGYWSASAAGTFYGSRALNQSQTYGSSGTYTISAGNLTETLG